MCFHTETKKVIVNAYVKNVFPHLHTWCSKISTLGMYSHNNIRTHMCLLMKTRKWQGNAIVFPALIPIVLGTILEGNTERLHQRESEASIHYCKKRQNDSVAGWSQLRKRLQKSVSDPIMTYVRKCKRRSHSVASRLCACAREDSTA